MKAKAAAAVLAATAALVALALPAGAAAAKTYRQPPLVAAELHLRGTNGFHFAVSSSEGAAVISARQASGPDLEVVNYFANAHGLVFQDGIIQMKVGKLGMFRGRFVAKSTKTHKLPGGCTGDPTIIENGFFVGSFDFRGELGYSTIHAHTARGSVTRQSETRCSVAKEHPRHKRNRAADAAKEGGERESTFLAGEEDFHLLFQASRGESVLPDEPSPVSFQASVTDGKAGVFDVSRSAVVFAFGAGAASTFQTPNLSEPSAEATIEPPAPFSGSATFHLETPNTASWDGNLAVELPGLGKMPLTGRSIEAGLCAPRGHCTKTLPDHLQQVLEAPPGVAIAFGTKKGDS